MRLQQARHAQGAVPDVGFKLTGNVLEYSETRLDLPKGAIAYPIHFLDVLHTETIGARQRNESAPMSA